MADLTRPPSLQEFFGVGCDLAAVPGLDLPLLAEMVDIENPTPERVAGWAHYYRANVDAWLNGEPSEMDRLSLTPQEHTQGDVCLCAWAADALESPTLRARIRWSR